MRRRLLRTLAVTGALAAAPLLAYETTLTPQLVTRAITLGHSGTDATRRVFHAPYRINVAIAPVDYVDIVTPYRRIVLEAQLRRQTGQSMLSQREAFAIADTQGDVVEVRVEMTFHPLNTFVGVPGYTVRMVDTRDGREVLPRNVFRVPRFGPRVDGLSVPAPAAPPAGSAPLTGGVIIAAFETRLVRADGVYEIVVEDEGKELARARVDLGALR